MLVLTRKLGEKVTIGEDVTITVLRVQGKRVAIGIHAPDDVRIVRREIFERHEHDEWELVPPEIGV